MRRTSQKISRQNSSNDELLETKISEYKNLERDYAEMSHKKGEIIKIGHH
jgi:hypothetical protein